MSQLALFGGSKAVTIPVAPLTRWPVVSERAVELAVELIRKGQLSIAGGMGIIGEFERAFAQYQGCRFALAQNNGTSALHAGLFAAGVGPGDEVLVPSYTWSTSVTPIFALGATPVFCEIDPRTLTLDPADAASRITNRTKAILVVHTWGNIADMDGVMALARQHHLKVVEDCAHAHGGEYGGRKVGSIGDVGCFSMQASKAMFGGEAGIIVTDDAELFDRIVVLGHQGRVAETAISPEAKLYTSGLGLKYRPHPVAIALAHPQLETLEAVNETRRHNQERLDNGLRNLPGLRVLDTLPKARRGGLYGYRLIYEGVDGIPRARLLEALQAEGVPVSPCRYELMHRNPLFRYRHTLRDFQRTPITWGEEIAPNLPVTERTYAGLMSLPVFNQKADAIVDQFIQAFQKVWHNRSQLA